MHSRLESGLIVGAYAAAPSLIGWDAAAEADYLHGVLAVDGVRGLELPWLGALHPHDPQWLLNTLPAEADLVLTDIGHAVGSSAADPAFGLASRDERGRARALADAARLRDDVARLVDAAGRRSVVAVELHSAPQASAGSAQALRASLSEIADWDWHGAALLIEHCDALVDGQRPEKGYLSLDDEISAVDGIAGMSLNWGRSAIELRDAVGVAGQIARTRGAGVLRGLMFSGASATDNVYGPAWEDNHPPFADVEPSSLLTAELAHEALAAAGPLDLVGVKMGLRPLDAPLEAKLDMIEHAVRTVSAARP